MYQREQCVSINGQSSSWQPVVSGVPQGSVLGPVMFILYVNDIPEHVRSLVKIFADDTKLYSATSNTLQLQNDLNSLAKWAEDWELTFNVDKCKVIHYGATNPNVEYTMGGKKLKTVEEECDLGVTFQRDLKFSSHISSKINKATSMLALIKRTFKHLDKYCFTKLYTSLVRPHLEFGNVIWYPYLRKDIERIENVQARATRLVSSLRFLPYKQRLEELSLPSLTFRRLRGDLIQTFKIIKGIDDCSVDKFFKMSSQAIVTRGHSMKIEKPRCTTSFALRQFSNRVINDWNSLPQHVVDVSDTNKFKILIDRHYKDSKMYEY